MQKLFFLVPAAIRTLKGQSLIKDLNRDKQLFAAVQLQILVDWQDWQEGCINTVDRSGPEAKLQDFSEQVWDECLEAMASDSSW